jgi:leader peptidase (prepilin peptidase)/N-methyltransferase
MGWSWLPALVCAAFGVLSGLAVPALIARIPEPEPEPAPEPRLESVPGGSGAEVDATVPAEASPPEPPKQLYADIARLPHLPVKTSIAAGLVALLLGGVMGWDAALLPVFYLVPVGVALAVVDWRTRLLPTRLIAPSYLVVAVLVLVAFAIDRDPHALLTAALGWLVAGGTFFVLWFVYPKGMGYGDVRLAGVLGLALGYQGWAVLLTGVYAGFLVGGVGGLLLSLLRLVDRKAYPFGPFILAGAVVGVVLGPAVGAWYG